MSACDPNIPRVVVVGGGITGMLTARRLALAGANVSLIEASERLGGQVFTVDLDGVPVDLGAEAIHLGSPAAIALVDELGLSDDVVGARAGTSSLWTDRGMRPMPAGVGPTGPTRLGPVLTSRIMTIKGLCRAGMEPLAALLRPPLQSTADISVGHFVSGRFGPEVTARFLDPLLGVLHAGDVNELSLRACAPGLVDSASRRRSIVLRRRRGAVPARQPRLPLFASWPQGLARLTERMLDGVDVAVRTGRHVVCVRRLAEGYQLSLDTGETLRAEAVVLAIPAEATANLLRAHVPSVATGLDAAESISVATVVVRFDRSDVDRLHAESGNGMLVPSSAGTLLKAVTNLSRKWEHLDDVRSTLLRLSAGRAGSPQLAELSDDALVTQLLADLHRFTGVSAQPNLVHVHRWRAGLPQLHVGHRSRMAAMRENLNHSLPGVILAGAPYDGLGLGSCIPSAETAAAAVLAHLEPAGSRS